jgi:hypothetical protein
MSICFTWVILLVVVVASTLGLVRWFELTVDAVDNSHWGRLVLLVVCPPAAMFYRSKVPVSRPVPVPRHEPVRGFGIAPPIPKTPLGDPQPVEPLPVEPIGPNDGPPPGTPAEFIGMPIVPPPKKSTRPKVDPAQVEKLRQKMRQQGMLPPDAP